MNVNIQLKFKKVYSKIESIHIENWDMYIYIYI